MPDSRTIAETEKAMSAHVESLPLDFTAAGAISTLYRAANAVRNHLSNTVLREHDLTWTGFVVLWVVWIWDGMETRRVADNAGISKATLTGVVKTLEARGWITRQTGEADRRLVMLSLTPEGIALMEQLYPQFNTIESEVVARLSEARIEDLTESLRTIVTTIEEHERGTAVGERGSAHPAEGATLTV